MDIHAQSSRNIKASRDLTSSNNLSVQPKKNYKFRSWESSQTPQPSNEQLQQPQPQQPSTGRDQLSRDALLDEIARQKRRIELLEIRTNEVEQRYINYSTLPETIPEKHLREYKVYAQQKFAAYDKEVRNLHELAKSLEQQSIDINKEVESALTELFAVKAVASKEVSNDTETSQMMLDIKEYKVKCRLKEEEAQVLQNEAERYQKFIVQAPVSAADTISNLKSNIRFNEITTGLTILDRETRDGIHKVRCWQSGKLGNIEYRLEFFTDMENVQQVNYIPLSDNIDDHQLATSMKDELQFLESDTHIFFWRMITYLNKPPKNVTR